MSHTCARPSSIATCANLSSSSPLPLHLPPSAHSKPRHCFYSCKQLVPILCRLLRRTKEARRFTGIRQEFRCITQGPGDFAEDLSLSLDQYACPRGHNLRFFQPCKKGSLKVPYLAVLFWKPRPKRARRASHVPLDRPRLHVSRPLPLRAHPPLTMWNCKSLQDQQLCGCD